MAITAVPASSSPRAISTASAGPAAIATASARLVLTQRAMVGHRRDHATEPGRLGAPRPWPPGMTRRESEPHAWPAVGVGAASLRREHRLLGWVAIGSGGILEPMVCGGLRGEHDGKEATPNAELDRLCDRWLPAVSLGSPGGCPARPHVECRLILVHATEDRPTFPYGDRPLKEIQRRRAIEAGRELLEAVAAELPADALDMRVVFGTPVEGLNAVCSEEAAELLVVGSRGRGSLTTALLGSVSAQLASTAACPVPSCPRTRPLSGSWQATQRWHVRVRRRRLA